MTITSSDSNSVGLKPLSSNGDRLKPGEPWREPGVEQGGKYGGRGETEPFSSIHALRMQAKRENQDSGKEKGAIVWAWAATVEGTKSQKSPSWLECNTNPELFRYIIGSWLRQQNLKEDLGLRVNKGKTVKTAETVLLCKSFLANDSGATAIEYALMSSLIALALVTILTNLGTRLSSEFSEISSVLK